MNYTEIKEKLEGLGQEQLLKFYDELSEEEKTSLLDEIERIDFNLVNINQDNTADEDETVEPLGAVTVDEIEANREEYEAIGLDAIRNGKVALVLLAGGQGTRLGADGPKGAYNIGVTRELYIFECLINNLMDVVKKAGCFIPLSIMTSDKNDAQTRAFFEAHDFFGYDKSYVDFLYLQSTMFCRGWEIRYLSVRPSSQAVLSAQR